MLVCICKKVVIGTNSVPSPPTLILLLLLCGLDVPIVETALNEAACGSGTRVGQHICMSGINVSQLASSLVSGMRSDATLPAMDSPMVLGVDLLMMSLVLPDRFTQRTCAGKSKA
ncbi:hypothetical protein EVAR_73687_1 [Eumeta japonica]|uniref:Uncharacterized protein n=1 Tax=Eumeta variegata TaxID=151549 RepID=A0A4C1SXM9_EUMVA|nr:hypothetical protein EVAR_73687_1 [Eumeta japonica]